MNLTKIPSAISVLIAKKIKHPVHPYRGKIKLLAIMPIPAAIARPKYIIENNLDPRLEPYNDEQKAGKITNCDASHTYTRKIQKAKSISEVGKINIIRHNEN